MFDPTLNRLGNSGYAIIEHNEGAFSTADWIIDLGPEGGDQGGHIVATGTPEEVAECAESYTGQYLARQQMPARRRAG